MRIILVQAEIELALRQYVFSQINIAEGQEIKIDFKNTRGDDGATAEINILKPDAVPGNADPVKPAQTGTQSRSTSTGTKTPATTSSAAVAPAVTATEATASEPEQSASTASSTEEVAETKGASLFPAATKAFDADQPVDAEVVTETAATKPATPTDTPAPSKSLFGNLTRPVNEKPAE